MKSIFLFMALLFPIITLNCFQNGNEKNFERSNSQIKVFKKNSSKITTNFVLSEMNPDFNDTFLSAQKNEDSYKRLLKRKRFFDLFLLFLLFNAFVAIFFIYQKVKNTRKVLREKETQEREYKLKHEKLRELLIQRFEISKQMAIINASPLYDLKEKKLLSKINEILYGKPDVCFNWEEFYTLLNELHGNLSIKLSNAFPELSQDEVHLCCLIKAGFNTSDICFILSYVSITIRTKKVKIRKKMGITDSRDLNDFLTDFINNQTHS